MLFKVLLVASQLLPMQIDVHVPGKLILAGEWAVLEPGHSCIVVPVDRYVTVRMHPNYTLPLNTFIVHAPEIGLSSINVQWGDQALHVTNTLDQGQQARATFVLNALTVAFQFIFENNPREFIPGEMTINSDISTVTLSDGTKVKPGLGSSAAVVVATITALLQLYGYAIDVPAAKDIIFKLSCIAHHKAQGSVGSCCDVAASAYAQPILYQRFESQWFAEKMKQGALLVELVSMPWPGLMIKPMVLPAELVFVIGFAGTSASTPHLIKQVHQYAATKSMQYSAVCAAIHQLVTKLSDALLSGNIDSVMSLIKENRLLLQQLACDTGVCLEIPALTLLIDSAERCGASAKFSGAGGGDCCIAVCRNEAMADKVRAIWQEQGLLPLNIGILR